MFINITTHKLNCTQSAPSFSIDKITEMRYNFHIVARTKTGPIAVYKYEILFVFCYAFDLGSIISFLNIFVLKWAEAQPQLQFIIHNTGTNELK